MKKIGKVLLITGPAGSGKSTLVQYAALHDWRVISEDDFWVRQGWGSGLRSSEQEKIIQRQVLDILNKLVGKGENVALEFILYHPNEPNPLTEYSNKLLEQKVEFRIVALKPSVDEIMRRLIERGRPNDINNLKSRRKDAENQVACLEANYIKPDWIIDPTDTAVEDVYKRAIGNF